MTSGASSCDRAACWDTLMGDVRRSAAFVHVSGVIRRLFMLFGFQEHSIPSSDALAGSAILASACVLFYYFHVRRRKYLARELRAARAQLLYLQDKLLPEEPQQEQQEIRIFIDGAFDLLHFGHMNAFRLARSLGTHLVAGINSDASITQCKGAPLMNDEQRMAMVFACKFVDEVVPDCPYILSEEFLDFIMKEYRIDFVVHGSDPCIVDGKDVYAAAKRTGKFLTIPRTEGVSTTDLVGRMLLLTKEHHCHHEMDSATENGAPYFFAGRQSKFLTTSRMLQLFSADVKAPTKDMRIIYVDGAWDLFHPGHVAFLKAAREVRKLSGTSLVPPIVGLVLSHYFFACFIFSSHESEVIT
jgi:ethanolamine-phosphate cytidylyltransferase